jgi:hypothetical protein
MSETINNLSYDIFSYDNIQFQTIDRLYLCVECGETGTAKDENMCIECGFCNRHCECNKPYSMRQNLGYTL